MAKLIGKGGPVGLWQCSHNLQLHLGLLVLPISSHLAPHTSSCQVGCQLILIQTSVLARFREKREIIPSGSALKKSHSRMSPAYWWHSSQSTAAMWALSRSYDRAGLVGRTSKFTDKGKTELMINYCQILSVEELWLSDQIHSKLLANEAKLEVPFWLNLSFVARRPAQRAVTPLSP